MSKKICKPTQKAVNTQDIISVRPAADVASPECEYKSILDRMNEVASLSSKDATSDSDHASQVVYEQRSKLAAIQNHLEQLIAANETLPESESKTTFNRMKDFADRVANGTTSDSDRDAVQKEIIELLQEVHKIGETTKFNNVPLFKNEEMNADVCGSEDLDVSTVAGAEETIKNTGDAM